MNKNMKKTVILFMVMIYFCMTGCSNDFAKKEYHSNKKIAKTEDRYAKEFSVFNPIEGGYSLTVSKFDGRETLWTDTVKDDQDIEMEFSLSLSKGVAKVVHIDSDDSVTEILECLPETSTDGYVTKTVSLKSGENRLKIVGYDCRDLELKMLFDDPE